MLGGYTSAVGLGVFAIAAAKADVLHRKVSIRVGLVGVLLLTPVSLFVVEIPGVAFVAIALDIAASLRRLAWLA